MHFNCFFKCSSAHSNTDLVWSSQLPSISHQKSSWIWLTAVDWTVLINLRHSSETTYEHHAKILDCCQCSRPSTMCYILDFPYHAKKNNGRTSMGSRSEYVLFDPSNMLDNNASPRTSLVVQKSAECSYQAAVNAIRPWWRLCPALRIASCPHHPHKASQPTAPQRNSSNLSSLRTPQTVPMFRFGMRMVISILGISSKKFSLGSTSSAGVMTIGSSPRTVYVAIQRQLKTMPERCAGPWLLNVLW